jgi:hypothetical protein
VTHSGRSYEELVTEGQAAILAQSKYQWTLGDLAIEVVGPASPNEGKSQDGKLRDYADDTGADYQRLWQYRAVATAWPESTRVDSVPWVNYRTIYKADDRTDIMATFVMACEEAGWPKRSYYRWFQDHLGKPKTREFSKINTKETADQALSDLPSADQAEVIAPRLAEPAVTDAVLENADARQAVVQGQARRHEGSGGGGGGDGERIDWMNEMFADLDEIRFRLRRIHDRLSRISQFDREPLAESLELVSSQASLVAGIVRNPSSAVLTDETLEEFLSAGGPRG